MQEYAENKIVFSSEKSSKYNKTKNVGKLYHAIGYAALALCVFGIALLGIHIFGSIASMTKYISYFVTGVKYTLGLSAVSVFFGIIFGSGIAFAKMSNNKGLSIIASAYIELIRGTPLITQLFIVFFGSAVLFNTKEWGLSIATLAFLAGIVAVSLNSAAYVAEIIRSGIQSVDSGQLEAGRSLGMSHAMTMKEIILPQAIKNILPALGNEFITVIKETSIVSVIGVTDIMYNVNIVRGSSFKSMEPLYVAAILYFVLTFGLSKLVNLLEGKLKESDKSFGFTKKLW